MIVKIIPRHNNTYQDLLKYILKEKDIHKPIDTVLSHNLKSNTIAGMLEEFVQNESFRNVTRKDQILFYHEILSLSANEDVKIPNATLEDIAQKYIQLRGLEGMLTGNIHRDTEHVHMHFITSALQFKTGSAFRLSKSALQEVKIELQKYHMEKFPELTESFCNHGKGKEYLTDRAYHAKTKHERARLKEEVQQTVTTLFAQSKSMDEFLTKLQEQGLHYYERKGIATGLVIDETKIRFTRLGIEKEALELLQNALPLEEIQPIKTPTTLKNAEINFPIDTEELNYNIKPDEFENYLDFEKEDEKETEQDLDQWIEDNLPKPQQELADQINEPEEIIRRNKKDLDYDLDL